jgi:TatD DNase family protein
LFDTHTHLDDDLYKVDREKVIAESFNQGMEYLVNVGTDLVSSAALLEMFSSWPKVLIAVGVHPHLSEKVGSNVCDSLLQLSQSKKVVAIGEIGLDYVKKYSPPPVQQEVFREQLKLAKKLNLPALIHQRGAAEGVKKILTEVDYYRVVMHCFSGDVSFLDFCQRHQIYLSFAGPITYKNNQKARQIIEKIDLDYLLVETDSPYLTPHPYRGRRNKPLYLKYIIETIAQIRNLSWADVDRITTLNAKKVFNLPLPKKETIAYPIRNSLYLNLTNRCTNRCVFCVRQKTNYVKGHYLKLTSEPSVEEILNDLEEKEFQNYQEVVFCGYGEPMLRLEVIKKIARFLKEKKMKTRINTNGQANLIYQRDILPELNGLIDEICVSLNAEDEEKYHRLCRSQFGPQSFKEVIKFIRECRKYVPRVSITVIDLPEIDLNTCQRLAYELGVKLRVRKYNDAG